MTISVSALRSVLYYEPLTGVFIWQGRPPWAAPNWNWTGKVAGAKVNGYMAIKVNYRRYYAHRLAWLYMTGQWPTEQIDHINLDRADNRWVNLRAATAQQNIRNRNVMRTSTTGIKGVYRHRKRYRALIGIDGKQVNLGHFEDAKQAAAVRLNAERHHFKEFARD